MPSHHDYGISNEEFCGGTPDDVDVPMSPEEFASAMQLIAAEADEEVRHAKADALMCDLLHSLGYRRGVEAFEAMGKWYA